MRNISTKISEVDCVCNVGLEKYISTLNK